jgi:hypothetical protein
MLIGTSEGEAISPALHRARLDRLTWLAAHAATGAVVGIVFLMTAKPSGAAPPLVILVAAGLGTASALPFTRGSGQDPATVTVPGRGRQDHPVRQQALARH